MYDLNSCICRLQSLSRQRKKQKWGGSLGDKHLTHVSKSEWIDTFDKMEVYLFRETSE